MPHHLVQCSPHSPNGMEHMVYSGKVFISDISNMNKIVLFCSDVSVTTVTARR